MPVQVSNKGFAQFLYAPSYLVEEDSEWPYISSPGACYPAGVARSVKVVPLILDGGAVVGNHEVAFVSERFFFENRRWPRMWLKSMLRHHLHVSELVVAPEHPYDFTGHLDGSIRVVDKNRAVVSCPPVEEVPEPEHAAVPERVREHSKQLIRIVEEYFDVIELVDVSHRAAPRPKDNAQGVYANFLQVGQRLLVPTYGLPEDEVAIQQLRGAGFDVVGIDARAFVDPAHPERAGGAINCVTWNWKSDGKN